MLFIAYRREIGRKLVTVSKRNPESLPIHPLILCIGLFDCSSRYIDPYQYCGTSNLKA
jgi:hypothetical protein